jgi:tetratricopeptide (TPR) repeat protein/photosystem II stability/assembly factor-like uncharacterized protein
MGELVNPYIAGAPVTETKMFFGREDVFDWIQNNLTGRYADHILVVHGQRRVGKTSVLKQLNNRLPERYIPVFFDLQGRTHTTLDRFLWWLAREIVRVLKQDRSIDLPLPEKEAFIADPEYFESQFLSSLKPTLGDHILLLTFDEFDNLEESEVREELARPMIDYFRRLLNNPALNFIFSIGSSGRKLENMQASYTEFFKVALYKKISFLTREQTHRLVSEPVEGILEYDRRAVEKIFEITFGHPYFTQLICHELFSLCQKTGQRRLSLQDVESILDDVIERGTVNLKFTWDEASDLEKWSLAALANSERLDQHGLAEFLKKQKVRFANTDLNSALLHLVEKDVLTSDYHFVIQLLKRWLQKNRPLEQVREELTEVNPIANRYIEIGLEFKNSNRYDRAIESFREALAVDVDNIQAQVSIAQVYMDQQAYEKAVDEFEKALAIDDEDVVARSGLCEAHLAIGDASMKKGRLREAVQSYQRVLGINSEHTDARQRLSELNQQRAEKALKEAREDEALSFFAEALKLTPEDPSLIARVEKLKGERKARELGQLLARSAREAENKDWEAAIATLEMAIQMAPEDPALPDRLASIKTVARKATLENARAKGIKLEETGRREEALAAWNEFLSLEPDSPEALSAVERINAQHQQERTEALKNRALSFAKSEKFAESLAAWEEYRQLKPDESQAIDLEVETVMKTQKLSGLYSEAQAAFAQKDYDHATRLFKDVILLDEDYKDASRRMAESVRLRRATRKTIDTRWMWIGLGLVALIAVGFLSYKPILSLFSAASALKPVNTQTGENVSPVTLATPTQLPTLVASTALPPGTAVARSGQYSWGKISSVDFASVDDITDIVVDGGNLDGKIYVSTANSGVYRSLDGGGSWQSVQNGLTNARIDDLVLDQAHHILYAAANDARVYKSTENGLAWRLVHGPEENPYYPYHLGIAPWNSQVIFESGNGSLYRSDDGGETWFTLNEKWGCPYILDFVFPPSQLKTIIAAGYSKPDSNFPCTGGIYKSVDAGRSWELIGMKDVYLLGEGGLVMAGDGGKILFVNGSDANWNRKAYRSQDGGYTWQAVQDSNCFPFRVNPSDPNQVYCRLYGNKLLVSNDTGASWQEYPVGGLMGDTFALFGSGDSLVIGSRGIYISQDGGLSWGLRMQGLGAGHLEFKVDPNLHTPLFLQEGVCLSKTDHPLYSSTSGESWTLVTKTGCDLTYDQDDQFYYRTTIRSKAPLLADKWLNWITLEGEEIISITASPLTAGGIFATTVSNKTLKYDLSNNSWNKISEDFFGRYPRLFFSSNGKVIYANAAYAISPDGKDWVPCAKNANRSPFDTSLADQVIAIDPRDEKHLFAASAGQGILESKTGCSTWNTLPGTEGWTVNGLMIDPSTPDTIYAATDSGPFVSFDNGSSWALIDAGLDSPVVYSITLDNLSNVLAATPVGIYKLESSK